MNDETPDDLATLWSLADGVCCIISCRAGDWHVRVDDRNGGTVRERSMPNSRSAMALASEWEEEFKGSRVRRVASASMW